MKMKIHADDCKIHAHYSLHANGRESSVRVSAPSEARSPAHDSEAHFFKEHDLGVGRTKRLETTTYEVVHPIWETYEITDFQLNIHWQDLYGPPFAFLSGRNPSSVFFAKGSEIRVYKRR